MIKNPKPTAFIAGGGVAGLYAAVLLDEIGYDVTLYEKKNILGGRTYSFTDKITGTTIDNGQHLLAGAYHETLNFLEKIGAASKLAWLIPTTVSLVDSLGKQHKFTLTKLPPPWNLLRAMFGFGALSLCDKLSLIKLSWQLRTKKPPIELSQTSSQDWLASLGQSSKAIENFWQPLILATLNDSACKTTADGLWQVLKKSYFAGPRDGFLIMPKVGLSDLFAAPAKRYLEIRGQKIITAQSLVEIKIIDNEVQGFLLNNDTLIKADLYVSALPHEALIKILPRPFILQHPHLSQLEQAQTSPIISINLFFDKPVLTEKFIGGAQTTTHWFFDKPDVARAGTHHIVGVISAAYDLLEKNKDELVKLALADLAKLCPPSQSAKLIHALVNKEHQATLSCRKGINQSRPKQKLLGNFYIVGDWTKTGLPPTIESAAMSARLMLNNLLSVATKK